MSDWLTPLALALAIIGAGAVVALAGRYITTALARPSGTYHAGRDRLARAGAAWAAAILLEAVAAGILHLAPRDGLWGGMAPGLHELVAILQFGARAALGCVAAAAVDLLLWPRISMTAIVWPGYDGAPDDWAQVHPALRAVALAGWIGLYLVLISAALAIEPVL